MFQTILLTLSLFVSIATGSAGSVINHDKILAQRSFSLEYRYPDKWVSEIFKDNILLALAYLRGYSKTEEMNWTAVEKPFHYEFILKPGEVFAFHDDVLPQYQEHIVKTTGSHFIWNEGYKSDGWLIGDGVCHLASFINWVARDAGLDVLSPTNHDFAAIPEVPREYGVAIFAVPGMHGSDELQNLYVKNNHTHDITFVFDYNGKDLKVSVKESLDN